MATCPNCNVEVEAGAKFCGECGAPIPQEKECPQCHAKWPVKAKFCGDCGFNFATGSMSAAGAALMGSGNTVAGDLVHNVNVVNSGNVNNVVTNNVVTSIVNNTISGGSASALMPSSVGNGSGKRKLTLIFEGMSLVGGYSRFDSFKDMLALPGIERKRLADPANCAVRFSGYILDDCKMSVIVEDGSESPVEHAIKIDSTDFYEDEPPRELMITEDIEKEFDYGSDGAAGYLLSFDRKTRIKFVGTIELPADYNPTALKIEGRKNIWGDYHVATRITYNGCEIALQPQAAQSAKPRKLIAWLKDEYWDLKADSDVDAWLADVTVEGANIQFSRKVFESEEDLSNIDVAAYENDFHELDDEYFDEHDSCFVAGKSRVTITNRFTGESAAANVVDGFNELSFCEASRCFDAPDFSAGAVELYMFAERQGARKYSQICYGEFGLSHVGFKCSKLDAPFDDPVYGLSEPMITGEVMDFDDSHFGELGDVSAWTVSAKGVKPYPGNEDGDFADNGTKKKYVVKVTGIAEFVGAKEFKDKLTMDAAPLRDYRQIDPDRELDIFDETDYGMIVNQARMVVVDESGEEVYAVDLNDQDSGLKWEEDDSAFCCYLGKEEVALYVRQKIRDGFTCEEFYADEFDPSKLKFVWMPFSGAKHGDWYEKQLYDIIYDGESLTWYYWHATDGSSDEPFERYAWEENSAGEIREIDLWGETYNVDVDKFIEQYLATRDLSKRPSMGTVIDTESFAAVLKIADAESGGQRRAKAKLIVGDCYLAIDGKGVVEHSEEKAFKYYQESFYHEYSPAMIMTGLCYEQGIGTAKDEWRAHLMYGRAARGGSKDAAYTITEKCKGCTMCARKCPAQAITGTVKKVHVIDRKLCTNCGTCEDVCKFHAVAGELAERI